MSDRHVYATLPDRRELVKYIVSGKYKVEEVGMFLILSSKYVSFAEAVELATQPGAVVSRHTPQGMAFQRAVRKVTGGSA